MEKEKRFEKESNPFSYLFQSFLHSFSLLTYGEGGKRFLFSFLETEMNGNRKEKEQNERTWNNQKPRIELRKTKELNISMDFLYIQKSEGGEIMKNKKLLFIGVLTAFLMLAVPFAVVSVDTESADADEIKNRITVNDAEELYDALVNVEGDAYISVASDINAENTGDAMFARVVKPGL